MINKKNMTLIYLVKVPFVNNRYDIDIHSDDYDLINIENICNFTKMRCDIYIDKIWKWNDVIYL